jgi:BirA family transcriptional regulator, biotin operon repressor / biotin---[acetyl-CoA-carboxylase] ligase
LSNRNTSCVGKVLYELPDTPSTNEHALSLLSGPIKAVEGTVILTHRQTQGRGQAGTRWESAPYENITLSIILYPNFLEARAGFLLSQAIALGVRDTIADTIGIPVAIKWPNDIYIAGRKTAGILLQTALQGNHFQYCVAGIGINVNQTSFSPDIPNPTSLALATGKQTLIDPVKELLFRHVDIRYRQLREGLYDLLETDYLRYLYRLEEDCLFEEPGGKRFEGRITGITDTGKLLVVHQGKTRRFDVKEISFVTT